MKLSQTLLILFASLYLALGMLHASIDMDLVPVTDAGNAPDPATGYGAVEAGFQIGKYDITAAQYCAFLNAVAKKDTYSLFDTRMESDPNVACIQRRGSKDSYTYSIIEDGKKRGQFPITYVSWFAAARFCNWVHNNQRSGDQEATTTERGAYLLDGIVSGHAVPVERGARCFLPSEDQWYKAAYYKGGGVDAGYYAYPTQSDIAPGNTIDGHSNRANYSITKKIKGLWGLSESTTFSNKEAPYLTSVGIFSASPGVYATYDMGGNVFQWVDAGDKTALLEDEQVVRGGAWSKDFNAASLKSDFRGVHATYLTASSIGFRVAAPLRDIKMEFVTVADPGNAPDSTSFGAVANSYKIGKYPVKASQYAVFLNSVATTTDPYSLYKTSMQDDLMTGSIFRVEDSGHYSYIVRPGWEDMPITYVSWFDVARFCNWMHNHFKIGDEDASTTETGAYDLQGKTYGSIVKVNMDAKYFIPSEHQWYKAAYYKGGGPNAGYWVYPTQHDEPPGNIIGDDSNQANYDYATKNTAYAFSSLSPVGIFKNTLGFYGTYDMGGNIWEWIDASFKVFGIEKVTARGGSFRTTVSSLKNTGKESINGFGMDVGFRVAAPVEMP